MSPGITDDAVPGHPWDVSLKIEQYIHCNYVIQMIIARQAHGHTDKLKKTFITEKAGCFFFLESWQTCYTLSGTVKTVQQGLVSVTICNSFFSLFLSPSLLRTAIECVQVKNKVKQCQARHLSYQPYKKLFMINKTTIQLKFMLLLCWYDDITGRIIQTAIWTPESQKWHSQFTLCIWIDLFLKNKLPQQHPVNIHTLPPPQKRNIWVFFPFSIVAIVDLMTTMWGPCGCDRWLLLFRHRLK